MPSAFNEAAPAPLLYSPSSSLVFARRKRSAFKGPMIHTTNLMVSSGMVHSPLPSQPAGSAEANPTPPIGRPAARKSQIIEEEEDDGFEDEIEEVDEFEEGAEEEEGHDGQDNQPGLAVTTDTAEASEPESPSSAHKPALEPAPELETSPSRPPRSSSLHSPPPEAAAAVAAVLANEASNDEAAGRPSETTNDTTTKPVTPSD